MNTGKVTLVGAGPGDPELLTLKALKAIQAATVLLVDDLVSPEVVAYASPRARIVQGVGLTSRDWQTLPILVNPPGFAPVASILLAYLHGLRGSFPELLRIARDPSSGGYIVAAIIDLQTVRESGRISRWEGADL